MIKKSKKYVYTLLHGTHTRKSPIKRRGVEVRKPGDTIEVDDPSELGNFLDCWKLVSVPKRKKKEPVTTAEQMRRIGGLPTRTVDGVITASFVETGDAYTFNGKDYSVFQNPRNKRRYWLSDDGYLSPISEEKDALELDKSGNVKSPAPDSDEPEVGLTAVHIGGGWWNVVNARTGEPINDRSLRKKEAMRLADGKIVESTKDMAGEQDISAGRGTEPYTHIGEDQEQEDNKT